MPEIRTVDDVLLANPSPAVHESIEEDEGIDLDDDMTQATGFQPLTGSNSWSFDNLAVNEDTDLEHGQGSPFDSGAASDEAQHDSSGDERVHSPRDIDFEQNIDPEYPGMSHYELPPQPDVSPPSYNEPPPPDYQGEITRDDMNQIWSVKDRVHEVPPDGAAEERSEEAAEIHLDEQDKFKLG